MRTKLVFLLLFSLLVLSGICLAGVAWYAAPRTEVVDLGGLAEFPPADEPYELRDPVHLYVVNNGEKVVVIDPRIKTPNSYPAKWNSQERKYIDPLTGTTYDLYGRPLRGPATQNLPRYPVEIIDGRVLIRLPWSQIEGYEASSPACVGDMRAPRATDKSEGYLSLAESSSYNIVYFLGENVKGLDAEISPACMQTVIHVQIVDSWTELLEIADYQPLDAVILHASAIPEVDRNWLARQYRQGVVITAIDITPQDFGGLIGSSEIAETSFDPKQGEHPFYIITSSIVIGENLEDVNRVVEALSAGNEQPIDGVEGYVEVLGGSSYGSFNHPASSGGFADLILDHINNISPYRTNPN